MKKMKKIAAAAAAIFALLSQTVFAQTYVAPIELSKTVIDSEDFDAATRVYENQEWLGYSVGKMDISYYDAGKLLDFAGVAPVEGMEEKALRIMDDESVEVVLNYNCPIKLKKGDIFTFSFDLLAKSGSDLQFYLKSSQCDLMGNQAKVFIDDLDVNTGNILTIGPNWISAAYAKDVSLPAKGFTDTFVNYQIVIDTCDETKNGAQTITYYQDGKKGNTFTIYPKADGVKKEELFSTIDGFKIISMRNYSVPLDFYLDNLSYTVETTGGQNFYETFSGIDFSSTGNMWDTAVGILRGYGPWSDTNTLAVVDGETLENSTKAKGDSVLKNVVAPQKEALYATKGTGVSLEKGDKYTISFEYYEADQNQSVIVYPNTNNQAGRTERYNYTSLITGLTAESSTDFMQYAGGRVSVFGVYAADAQEAGFSRYDIVIDTCDEAANGEQTAAFYRNGTLMDKGIFYKTGTEGCMTEIANVGWCIGAWNSGSVAALDNIWLVKSSDNLRVSGSAVVSETEYKEGRVEITYERPAVFEQDGEEIFVAAQYDADGKLVDCAIEKAAPGSRISEAGFDVTASAQLKLFVWNAGTLTPISASRSFDFVQ